MLHTSLASLSSAKTLPYLVMFLTSNLGGWAGDYLIARPRHQHSRRPGRPSTQ